MLTSMAGIDMLHVPYKSIPLGLNDVIAGQVDMMFTDMATGTPQVKGGKLRALGVSSLAPVPALPDVPPIAQTLKGFELLAWYAMYAPAGTPAPVIERLNRELRAFVGAPATVERLTALGLQPMTSTPQELADFGRGELAKWARLIQQAGIQPE
jgi:tripartite-type tricarboxylate transporter receptor subunit TctC